MYELSSERSMGNLNIHYGADIQFWMERIYTQAGTTVVQNPQDKVGREKAETTHSWVTISHVEIEQEIKVIKHRGSVFSTVIWEGLESCIDADWASGYMCDLSRDVVTEVGLVPGQHFQHRTQIGPPLNLGHSMPEKVENTDQWWSSRYSPETDAFVWTAYSKSVIAFRSVTGMNETTFLLRPRTHAVSGEFANTRPEGRKKSVRKLTYGAWFGFTFFTSEN